MSSRPWIPASGALGLLRSGDARWIVPGTALVLAQYFAAIVLGYSIGFVPSLPTLTYMAIAFVISLLGASVIILPRLRRYWREGEQSPIARLVRDADRGAVGSYIIGFQLVALQMGALTWLKDLLPAVIPYWADPALASLDRAILGTDAWRVIPEWLTRPLDIVYVTWALVETVGLLVILCIKPSPLKTRAMFAYFLTVGVMGVCGQYVLSSAGPVFYDAIVGGDRFAALVTRNAVYAPFVQLGVDMLWASYASQTGQIGNGISAMPSMHVATTAWVALSFSALWPKLRVPSWGYWLAIFVGSFALGWHYFLDGVAGSLGALACWGLSGRLLGTDRGPIARDSRARLG